ncbi:MAG: hypothetical protein Q7T57_05435, partial [Dehalococcoidales bacterium]|nr:hypothetical protein [Dehalococcoidales bacterium]
MEQWHGNFSCWNDQRAIDISSSQSVARNTNMRVAPCWLFACVIVFIVVVVVFSSYVCVAPRGDVPGDFLYSQSGGASIVVERTRG